MAYYLLAAGAFRRHLQYRWAHMVNNLASVGFGYIFMAVWAAVPPERLAATPGGYTVDQLVRYVAFNQTLIWITMFLPVGLGIPGAIRSGQVATEMQKPLPYFPMVVARESGSLLYHLSFRALPMAAVFTFTSGYPLPAQPLAAAAGVALSAYVGLCLHYLMGISAFWTKEVRWAWWLFQSTFAINGVWLPVDLLPDAVRDIALLLPFSAQVYYPAAIWMGWLGPAALVPGVVWAVVLTGCSLVLTWRARRRLEVQGG